MCLFQQKGNTKMDYYTLIQNTVKEVGVRKVTEEILSVFYPKCYNIYLKNGYNFTVAFKDNLALFSFFDNGEFYFAYKGEVVKVDDYFMKRKLKKLVKEIYDNYLSEKWNNPS